MQSFLLIDTKNKRKREHMTQQHISVEGPIDFFDRRKSDYERENAENESLKDRQVYKEQVKQLILVVDDN